jgi:hypothetical protein
MNWPEKTDDRVKDDQSKGLLCGDQLQQNSVLSIDTFKIEVGQGFLNDRNGL